MKKIIKERGLFEFTKYRSDDDHEIQPGDPDFEAMWAEISKQGFVGLADFLRKAEALADEQLIKHGLPIDWPKATKMKLLGRWVDGWETPDECEPKALQNTAPNAAFAAKLKDDVHDCRQYLSTAEQKRKIRERNASPTNIVLTHEQVMSEAMYRGVIVTLSYWRLKANVQWERWVKAGDGTRKGGLKGAESKHGSQEERIAKQKRWQRDFEALRQKKPRSGFVALTDEVGIKNAVTGRTVREYVKNPTPRARTKSKTKTRKRR